MGVSCRLSTGGNKTYRLQERRIVPCMAGQAGGQLPQLASYDRLAKVSYVLHASPWIPYQFQLCNNYPLLY